MNRKQTIALLVVVLLALPALGLVGTATADREPWAERIQLTPHTYRVIYHDVAEEVTPSPDPYPEPDGEHWRLDAVVDGERWITIDLDAPDAPKLKDIDPRDFGPDVRGVRAIRTHRPVSGLPVLIEPATPGENSPPAPSLYRPLIWWEWWTGWRYAGIVNTNPDRQIRHPQESFGNGCGGPSAVLWEYEYSYSDTGRNASTLTVPQVLSLGYDTTRSISTRVQRQVSVPSCWEATSNMYSHFSWARFETIRERMGCERDWLLRCISPPAVVSEEHNNLNQVWELTRTRELLTWQRLD